MRVEVIMAWPRRHKSMMLDLPSGATLAQALQAMDTWEEQTEVVGYAIFGISAQPSTILQEGDRVELLRGLQIDPKEARRRRASKPAR
ncbi:MAG: RnfH family protein [Pseudoxanthomonas sp.]